ncbi:MAG: PorT family protein [Chitinophagaceae bacterium]|nr:PorT family protein [Chitinophagaceae bacterium]
MKTKTRSMKKLMMAIVALFTCGQAMAQYNYSPTGIDDVPVLGWQWGLTGGGFTAMLPNRDDLSANNRLDPQMLNFSYAAGIEGIKWFQPTVGFGGQALLWNGGAYYTGYDSTQMRKFSAQTSLSYLRLPFLFHFKSFNRYKPNKRLRLNTYFGPYVAFLTGSKDKATYEKDSKPFWEVSGNNVTIPGFNGTYNGNIYATLELGFVTGVGFEFRLWKRTVLALSLRADYGITDVEDKRAKKFSVTNGGPEVDANPWKNLYAKYTPATAADFAAGYGVNRPTTKNFSVGGFIALRKYTQQ